MTTPAHSEAARRNGRLYGGKKPRSMAELEIAFWSHVKVGKPDQCWTWTACRNVYGYGQFCWNGKVGPAHRFSLIREGRVIPEGYVVCHHCDNPPCVNPRHLFIGTLKDNNADCRAKGRAYPPPRITHLTDDQARFIIRAYKPHKITVPMLARMFKVGSGAIRAVLFGRTWKHIKTEVESATPYALKG